RAIAAAGGVFVRVADRARAGRRSPGDVFRRVAPSHASAAPPGGRRRGATRERADARAVVAVCSCDRGVRERVGVAPPAGTAMRLWERVARVFGVNGVGKTTTIAKLAHRLTRERRSVLLAAADTFRAGAGEQLKIWADRLAVPCVSGAGGADPAAVAFDAVAAARARGVDTV